MAAAIAELAAGAAEGGEAAEAEEAQGSKKGFKPDSKENALSQGVDPSKILMGALSLAAAILSLVVTIKKGKEERQDIKDRRYAAGLLTSKESRDKLIVDGIIPAYYSSSNIRSLLKRGTLPYGWSEIVASSQGFAPEVQAWLLRQRRTSVQKQRDEDLKRKLTAARIKAAADKSSLDAKTQALAEKIRASVVG